MYINDVIDRVKKYFPSEYSDKEMYEWCDEVGAMLAIEDKCMYNLVTLTPDSEGCVMLPPEVEIHNIISVSHEGQELSKNDIREVEEEKLLVGVTTPVRVVYLVPYKPIRQTEYSGPAMIEGNTITIPIDGFYKYDTLNLKTGDDEREISIIASECMSELPKKYRLTTFESELSGLAGEIDVTLKRRITDKTLAHSPYDMMYADYLMAKIALYQRDYNTYSQFMTSFNSRLSAYKKWLVNHMPQAVRKLENWW